MYINKGKVSALTDREHATVVPSFSDTPVTTELVIPFYLLECLEVGMDVVYTQFPDNTGVILARMDGEWNHKVWKDPKGTCAVRAMTGDVETVEGNAIVTAGNVKITAGDMSTSVVPSYNWHTHGGVEGGPGVTQGPK